MHVALIGYGEVGKILAEDLRAKGHAVTAWDRKLRSKSKASAPLRTHARAHGVQLTTAPAGAVRQAKLIVSAVTASQTVPAAAACARFLSPGVFFLDLNSASPGAKSAAAERVARAGGRYVEGAVMTSVPPYRIKVPLLLGGPHARVATPVLARLGFVPKVASPRLGIASATKMCRSVIIKGLEATVIESFTAARHHGVETAVIASLRETFPGIDWSQQAAYFFRRVIAHGRRRAEEMREAAVTVCEAGLSPWSATATAQRQSWMADLADQGLFRKVPGQRSIHQADWRVEADRILAQARRSHAARSPVARSRAG